MPGVVQSTYKDILLKAPNPICIASLRGEILTSNSAHRKIYQCIEKPLSSITLQDIFGSSQFQKLINDLDATQKEVYQTIYIECNDGSQRQVNITAQVLPDSDEILLLSQGTNPCHEIITHLTLFRTMVDQSQDAFFVIDVKSSRILEISQKACDHWGYSRAEMLQKKIIDLNPNYRDLNDWQQRVDTIKDGKTKLFETTHRINSGQILPLEISHQYIENEGRDYIIAVARDISRRKKYEQDLELLKSAIEQSAESILITDTQGNIEYANQAIGHLTGYISTEVIGQNPRLFKSGQQDDSFYKKLWSTVSSGHVWHGKMINRAKDGSHYTEDCTISPVFDGQKEICNYVAAKRDITNEERLENQLRQAQKMDAVGQLAGGVAHDFNNMLGIIMGHSELALLKADPNDPYRKTFSAILDTARRSADLTKQLLAFSRQQTIDPKVMDLNQTIDATLKMLTRLIGEDIDLVWAPDLNLWPVKMDASQLDQILVNLCVNAQHAIGGTGKITIGTENIVIDSAYCEQISYARPGKYVLLAISDNGGGIPENIKDKIFDPFFTTKAKGKGTGLGLSTIYGIVKQNNGFINVYSEIGQGTTFKIYLPRHANAKDQETTTSVEGTQQGQGQTILVVEDSPDLLNITTIMLESLGYKVFKAATLAEALTHANNNQPIDLLLTDVVMPEMNGKVLAEKISAICPSIKILYMSGYTANTIAHHGVLDEGIQYLPKPFFLQGLSEKVAALLNAKS